MELTIKLVKLSFSLFIHIRSVLLVALSALASIVALVAKSTPSWFNAAISNITTFACIVSAMYLLFDYAWKRRYQRRHKRSSSLSATGLGSFIKEERQDLTNPGGLISGIHVFSFLEGKVLELLANSAVIEPFSSEPDLSKILDSHDLVIIETGKVNTYYSNVLIGCTGKGALLSSLLDLLCLLTDADPRGRVDTTMEVVEGGTVVRIPKGTIAELKRTFPLNAAHLIQLTVSRFVRVTLGILKDYTEVDGVAIGALELAGRKPPFEAQSMIEEGKAEGCFLEDNKRAQASGAAFKYLLAVLNITHIPTGSTLLDRLIQDNELLQIEYFERGLHGAALEASRPGSDACDQGCHWGCPEDIQTWSSHSLDVHV